MGKYSTYVINMWEKGKVYTKCPHGVLPDRERFSRNWLRVNSALYRTLKEIVVEKKLLEDLVYFARFKHSGNLESHHSLLTKYCPKQLSFSFGGMLAHTQIAVFDHNCSIEREQSTTKAGKLRYKMHYSKVTDQCVFKKIMEPKEKTYIKEIIDEIKYGDKRNWKYM